jgi:hypothetical protein
MPILKNLNNLDMKINKRITKAMLKQASQYLPDVPPQPIDPSIETNFNLLMKSLSVILILLQETTVERSLNEDDLASLGEDDASSVASSIVSAPFFRHRPGARPGSSIASSLSSHSLGSERSSNADYEDYLNGNKLSLSDFSSSTLSKEVITSKYLAKNLSHISNLYQKYKKHH